MTFFQRSAIWPIALSLPLVAILGESALAQSLNLDFGQGGSATARIVQLVVLLTVITLAPSILLMVTSFARIVIVLSLLRTALGTQGAPPNSVVISLALFMTFFIMQPTLEKAYDNGVAPLIDEQITEEQALERTVAPIKEFMMRHVREKDVDLFRQIAGVGPINSVEDMPIRVIVPAFMISELKRAFEIGFLLFIPFLIIDMVVASVLMSMGMMMLPPVMISLPFKLIFFVLVDGWYLVVGSLIQSFGEISP
ncbi:MAG: flagellar type III secretion system pore protein FliP [Alphaproteobacteria bacterium]